MPWRTTPACPPVITSFQSHGESGVLNINEFSAEFWHLTQGWNWEVQGFLDGAGYLHPIDSDTKVISTVFERFASPVIRSIAARHGYVVEVANQTTYPDFTLSAYRDSQVAHRIAIDVKTTYASANMVFTLGGYNSFLRNGTKNILYPYSTYGGHWILGFVYRQSGVFGHYDLSNMPRAGDIRCPYTDVVGFIREKHEISGIRAGSGNTKNIGSVRVAAPRDFATVRGPFMQFSRAKEACDHYWKNYEALCPQIATAGQLLAHADFAQFR